MRSATEGARMAEADAHAVVRRHLRQFFAGHACEEHQWTLGPAVVELPRLRVAEFAPGSKIGLWVYATVGAWEARDDPRLEFVIAAPSGTSGTSSCILSNGFWPDGFEQKDGYRTYRYKREE